MLLEVSSPKQDNKKTDLRQDLLESFAKAMASRPFDSDRMRSARLELLKARNKEVLIEAACTGAFFEMVTKVVDISGRPVMGRLEERITKVVLWILSFFG